MLAFPSRLRKHHVWLIFVGVNLITVCFAINDYPQLAYVKTKLACQNETIHFNCPSPSLLEIQAASFGRGMSAICANGANADRLCDLIDKKALVKKMCDFKPECEVVASEEKFGNDCPQVDKYLNVIYACVRNPEKPTPPPITKPATNSNTTVKVSNTPTATANHTEPSNVSVTTREPTLLPRTEQAVLTSRPSVKPKPQRTVITFNPNGPDLDFLSNSANTYRELDLCKLLLALMMAALVIHL